MSEMLTEVRLPIEFFEILHMPDVHFDNPHCVRPLMHRWLKQAVDRNAGITFSGDFFCAMQGKGDPRRNKDGLRPEYSTARYIDNIIDDAAEQLLPYAKNIVCFFHGNHETSILNHLETSLLDRLVTQINDRAGTNIQVMGYHGYVAYKHGTAPTKSSKKWSHVMSKLYYHHHGNWGGVITKGMLGVGRYASVVPDADVIVTGHTHDHWSNEHPRFSVDIRTGKFDNTPQIHLKVGTLKEEFLSSMGWAVERIVLPKAIAGWWSKHHIIREYGKNYRGYRVGVTYEKTM